MRILLLVLLMLQCASASRIGTTYDPDQPLYPVANDDAFFRFKPAKEEVYRVLISRENYQVRQVAEKDGIKKRRDVEGDQAAMEVFSKFHDRYAFKDWIMTATLRVRLNPQTGNLENLEFVSTENPTTWQFGKLVQNDFARYRFDHPGQVKTRNFRVRYELRIKRSAGMTDEEARERALEFLRGEL